MDNELTLFGACAGKGLSLAERSVQAYVRSLAHFFDWLEDDQIARREGWQRFSEARMVRGAIERRLVTFYSCRVKPRQRPNGEVVRLIAPSPNSGSSLIVELAALKAFYEVCRAAGIYADENPLTVRPARKQLVGAFDVDCSPIDPRRRRMPRISGVDPPGPHRESDSYFLVSSPMWNPDVRSDRGMRLRFFEEAEKATPSLRYFCISSILFDSGARVSEVCAATMFNWWRASNFGAQIDSPSKGSHGHVVKALSLDKSTAKALRTYIDTERKAHDPEGRGLKEFEVLAKTNRLPRDVPIFLNRFGRQVTPGLYRDRHFRKTARAADMTIGPHAARHNFVSLALEEIDRTSKSPAERQLLREQLVNYVGWKQGDRMLQVYDKRSKTQQLVEVVQKLQRQQRRATNGQVGTRPPEDGGVDSLIQSIIGDTNEDEANRRSSSKLPR